MKQRVGMPISYLYTTVVLMLERTFSNRIVKVWNSLPATADVFATVRRFKSFIERVDLSEYVIICNAVLCSSVYRTTVLCYFMFISF